MNNEIKAFDELVEDLKGYYDSFGADYEHCWTTTYYEGEYCPLCPHRFECGGYKDRS